MRTPVRRRPSRDTDRGATAVEYGLLLAAVAAMIAGTVFAFGSVLETTYQKSSDCIEFQGQGDPWPDCTAGPAAP